MQHCRISLPRKQRAHQQASRPGCRSYHRHWAARCTSAAQLLRQAGTGIGLTAHRGSPHSMTLPPPGPSSVSGTSVSGSMACPASSAHGQHRQGLLSRNTCQSLTRHVSNHRKRRTTAVNSTYKLHEQPAGTLLTMFGGLYDTAPLTNEDVGEGPPCWVMCGKVNVHALAQQTWQSLKPTSGLVCRTRSGQCLPAAGLMSKL